MKLPLKTLGRLFLVIFLFFILAKPLFAQNEVNLYLFWSNSCPHCKDEITFLQEILPDYPNLEVHAYEISANRNNSLLFQKIGKELKVDVSGVPITFIGDDYFSGYLNDRVSGSQIIYLVDKFGREGDPDLVGKIIDPSKEVTPAPADSTEEDENKKQTQDVKLPEKIKVPLIGEVELKNLSLPALTFMIALVDGFNPCAMWVLLFLISLLLGMKDRAKMWVMGSVFIFASGLVYFLFLSAWLNMFLFLGFVTWVRIAVGLVALTMGIYQLRDYVKNKDGACKVVGGEKRKKVFDKLRDITQKKEFLVALLGIIVLAFAVNLVELVCSAGLPAVYTQVLSLTSMPRWQYYLYLLFYIIVFMIDDMAVFVVAMVSLKAIGLESKYARYSRLIGGIVILAIGILMLFKPEILMFA